jgi:hypothetical protein
MLATLERRPASDPTRHSGILQLLRRTDGATVVEFGLVVAPFIAMLFAILQTTLVFFAGRILDHDRACESMMRAPAPLNRCMSGCRPHRCRSCARTGSAVAGSPLRW